MTHRLLIFGDSWAWGAELDEDLRLMQSYGGQLGRMLGVDSVEIYAEAGSSIEHMNLQLRDALNRFFGPTREVNTKYTAVFFLTGQERHLIFDPNGEFGCMSASGATIRPCQNQFRDLFNSMNDMYFKYFQSNKLDTIKLNTNLLAFHSLCQHYNIDDYYISGWEPLPLWHEIDRSRFWTEGRSHCAELFGVLKNGSDMLDFKRNDYIKPN